jgi:hypothetical protein
MATLDAVQGRAQRVRQPPPRRRNPLPPILPLVVFGTLAVMTMIYIGYVLWPRWPAAEVDPSAPALPVVIAGVTFNVPPAAVRVPVQRRPGSHERIDLAYLWPSLEPAGAKVKASVPDNPPAPMQALERIFLTIMAAGGAVPPADRVQTIYPRYTVSEAAAGPAGLAVLAFRDGTPYQGEDLIYDSEAPGFLVRCTRTVGLTPGTCLYERWIDTAKLVLRFPREWLDNWRELSGKIDQLIASLRPLH